MTAPTTGTRAADRLAAVSWAALVVGAAFLASVLAGALAGTSVPVLAGMSVTRSGMDAAGVACVGLTLLGVLLPLGIGALPGSALRDLTRVQATADRALVGMAGTWLVLVLLGVAFRAADAFGRPLSGLAGAEVLTWATQLAAGRGMVLTAGCAAVVLGCGVARLRTPDLVQVRIPLIAALLGVITPAVTGHAGSAPDHQLAVVTVALHVGSAALWVGGLAAVVALVARHRALLDGVLPRFSRLAGVCIVAVAISGLLNAQVRLESWAALVTTGYGWLVITKAVLLVAIGGLGGLARRRIAAGRSPALRWAGLEMLLMAVTLGIAAALTQTG